MADNFTRIIEKAKREGEAKLKIIAPKFKVPTKVASQQLISRRTSGRSGGGRVSMASLEEQRAFKTQEKLREEQERLKRIEQEELRKLERIKVDIARANLSRERKINLINQVNRQKEAIKFQTKMESGEIQGFSGFGLSPSQFKKREFLLKSGFKEKKISTKEFVPFRNLDPLVSKYFVNRNPNANDKQTLIDLFRNKQFNTARVNLPKNTLNRGRSYVKNINNYIKNIRADPSKASFFNIKINNEKNSFIRYLKNYFGSRINFTTRTATLLAMVVTNLGIGILTTTGEIIRSPKKSVKAVGRVAVAVGKFSKETIKKTPKFVKDVADDPKLYAKKGWTVSNNLFNIAKKQSTIFVKLFATEPEYAIALIGREVVVLYATGGVFKVIGVVGGATKIKVLSSLRKVKTLTKIRLKKIPAIRKFEKKVDMAKINIQYKESLKNARKIRIAAGKKGKTLMMTSPDYKRSLNIIEKLTDATAEVNALKFINGLIAGGERITFNHAKLLIKNVKTNYLNALRASEEYKTLLTLSKLNRFESVKLIKQGKIKSARILFNKYLNKINKSGFATKISASYKNIKRGITKPIKRIKSSGEKEVRKFKTKLEIRKSKLRARKIRIAAGKKGKTVVIGKYDYANAVDFVESFADNYAKVKAKKIIKSFKKAGKKFGLGEEDRFLKNTQIFVRKELNKINDFKKLKEAARLNEPFAIKLVKIKKLDTAKRFYNKLKKNILSIKVLRKIKSFSKKIKTSPKRIKKVIKKRIQVRKQKQFIRKTIKYRLDKAKPIREVTLSQLSKSSRVSNVNKVIDSFFNQMAKKHQIGVSQIKFNQLKNIIKKRAGRAIKSGDKKELNNLKIAFQKLMRDMKKPSSNPNIKVVEKVGRTRRIRTIKDFDTPRPKGTYVEVKVGNQVLLQRVEAKVKTKVKQKAVQKLKIVQVQKKKLNIKPLLEFGIKSVSASAFRNILKSKQQFKTISNQAQLLGTLQNSKQDFKVFQAIGQALSPKLNVASAVASKLRTPQRAKQKLIQRKKTIVIPRIPRKFTTKKLSKSQQTYHVITKKRGKIVRLYPSSLTIRGARDYLAYSIDNNLTKSAWLVPSGTSKNVRSPPKNIQGYFSKVSKKLRPYKIRHGKKKQLLNGYIEKRKYFQDTKGERKQATRLRKKVKKRKTVKTRKRKVVRRKKK